MQWFVTPGADLGFLPSFLSEKDPRPAAEQIHANYTHGGGWNPQSGFIFRPETLMLLYPGDPPMLPRAASKLRDQMIYFYDYSYVLILEPDGKWECARVD